MKKMLILDENFRRHLEAFASEVFIYIYIYINILFVYMHILTLTNVRET